MSSTRNNLLFYSIAHTFLQLALIYLFLTQFSLFNIKIAVSVASIAAIIIIPVIFLKKVTTAILTNSFSRTCLFIFLVLSVCLNLFLLFHWILSNHEILPNHMFYPWILTDELGNYAGASYDTIISPLVFAACCITFLSGTIFLLNDKKGKALKLFSIGSIILQAVFITILFIVERPSFVG